ncbi:MAG: sugar transferase [Clostridia bacterium]|nr:sugar transferase [Clostridia bacterium]
MKGLKRSIDFVLSLVGILILTPLYLVLVAISFITIGSPVFFKQARPGLKGKLFYMYKFRTMTDRKDANGNLLPDKDRLTRYGKFLRSTSLDEIPELFNVLKGDMSLVGPRPLLVEYLQYYTPEQMRRHDMRPGITGWAQINGRNAISWEQKFSLDTWYIDNWSLWLDLKILVLTVMKVFKREGISAEGSATMEKFRGSSL